MNVMTINIYKTLYILILFILVSFRIFELHLTLFFLVTILFFFNSNTSLPKKLFTPLSILSLILVIGILASLLYQKTFYNWLKDFMYFLKPILALISGYFLAKKINNIRYIFKGIVIIAAVFSIIHLVKIGLIFELTESSINRIRNIGGISNLIEVFAIAILLGSFKYDFLNVFKNKRFKKLVLTFLSISFIMYFSRTMLIALIIFTLAIFGYLKLTYKGLKYSFIVLFSISLFYIYLFSVDLERDKPGLESFLYKLKIAPAEIFIPSKNINTKNNEFLWDHWRAYEVSMALEGMKNEPSSYIIGKGLGALVDLKFDAPLSSVNIRFIPILHNGYMYVFFKTGIVGILLYFIFLLSLFSYSLGKKNSSKQIEITNLITGIGIYYIFTSLIITGIYNLDDIFAFILGTLFCLQASSKNSLNQTLK